MSNFCRLRKIHCKSGHGGAGSAHLRREKYIPKGGPDGGDGEEEDMLLWRNAQEWTLLPLRYTRHVKAERGKWWQNQLTGAYGADVLVNVPIGTIAKNEEGGLLEKSWKMVKKSSS